MRILRELRWMAASLGMALSAGLPLSAQEAAPLLSTGQITLAGRVTPYRIRHLPVSSFPELPAVVARQLNQRGCLVPQTYQAHRPENVIRASLEQPGSTDWAVLCAVNGTVSLLVFLGSAPELPQLLASAPETERLQAHDPSGVLGFDWGIDPASPEQIRQARAGMEHRPAAVEHDALADTLIDRRTVYHFYSKGIWTVLEMPE
jgi:hypothetical protein